MRLTFTRIGVGVIVVLLGLSIYLLSDYFSARQNVPQVTADSKNLVQPLPISMPKTNPSAPSPPAASSSSTPSTVPSASQVIFLILSHGAGIP